MATDFDEPYQPQPPRGYPLVAWVVIVFAVLTAFAGQLLLERKADAKKKTENIMLEMQARQLVALAQWPQSQGPQLFRDAEPRMKKAHGAERLRVSVVLSGELVGPDEALRQLHGLDLPDDDRDVAEILDRLYENYRQEKWDAPALTDPDRDELRHKLGWFGELALHPANGPDAAERSALLQPGQRALWFLLGAAAGFFALGIVGINFLIVMAILLAQNKARLRFTTGSTNGGIYAETFALWMVLFMGAGFGAAFIPAGQNHVLVSTLVALSSLSALAWPVFRGIPFCTVRQEIGLNWTDRPLAAPQPFRDDAYIGYPHDLDLGRETRPQVPAAAPRSGFLYALLEPLFGLAGYVGTLPLLFVGALLTFGLLQLAKMFAAEYGDPWGLAEDPNHPIGGLLLTGNWWVRLQIIFAASVGAPIVEETMFRGVLYRHLREATGRWARWLSVLASAALVSFVFAVIHPQGLLGVPALMSLAIGFSLVREWRGTLVPSIVAHGLNNLMVTLVLLLSAG